VYEVEVLKQIKYSRSLTEKIASIDKQLKFYYSLPIGDKMGVFFLTFFNFALVSFFFALSSLIGTWGTVAIAAVTLFFVRGSIMTKKLNRYFLQKKLANNEVTIDVLLKEKNNCLEEIKSILKISEQYFNVKTLSTFESWIESGKASSIEECVVLFKKAI
jgi:hypothetical protein